jgi:hypothetical protein
MEFNNNFRTGEQSSRKQLSKENFKKDIVGKKCFLVKKNKVTICVTIRKNHKTIKYMIGKSLFGV